MTNLIEKMKQEMVLIGFAESTQRNYLRMINDLYNYYKKPLIAISIDELRNYLFHLKKSV